MAGNYQDKTKALIDFVGLSAYDAVQYALDNGAKIDSVDDLTSDGDTPLIIAIKCQDIKMVSLLLNRKRINVNQSRSLSFYAFGDYRNC
jgi:ankyrin repeat protein